jgi:hypothetical protein
VQYSDVIRPTRGINVHLAASWRACKKAAEKAAGKTAENTAEKIVLLKAKQ